MMKQLFVAVVGLTLLISVSAFSQQQSSTWTLERCITHGLQNSIRVRQGQLDVVSAEIGVKQSQLQRLPSLNASTSVGTNLGRSINPFTNQFTEGTVLSQSLGASAGITLFNGFVINNTIKRSQMDQKAGEYALQDIQNQVTLDIIGLFTQVMFNKEQLRAAEARLVTSQAQQGQTSKQVELGVFPEANLLQARQQVAADELQVVNFKNAVSLSLLQLKQLIMVDPSEEFDISVPELTLTDGVILANAQAVYEEAEVNLPSIKAADARVESASYGVKIAEGARYPSLTAGIGWNTAYSSVADSVPTGELVTANIPIGFVSGSNTPVLREVQVPAAYEDLTYWDQLSFNSRSNIGVTLSIPIFNNYQVQAQVDRAKVSLEQAKVNAVNSRNTLRQAIEQAYQNVLAAKSTHDANFNQVEAQRELFDNVEQRYNLGAANAVEYTQARNNLAAAESDLIRAKFDYIFKQKVLDFYQNKPLTFN